MHRIVDAVAVVSALVFQPQNIYSKYTSCIYISIKYFGINRMFNGPPRSLITRVSGNPEKANITCRRSTSSNLSSRASLLGFYFFTS